MNVTETSGQKPQSYGVYLFSCPACGWHTMGRIKGPAPMACAACGRSALDADGKNQSEFRGDVACVYMSMTEWVSRAVQEEAEKHGLMVYQVSTNRWVVLRVANPCTFRLKADETQVWGYMALESVCGPADWQTVTKYLREKTPKLPTHLA